MKSPRKRGNEAAFEKALKTLQIDSPLAQEIVQEMISARIRAGLTQAQLAKRMGTTQSAIARSEAGRGLPGIATLQKLAVATGSRLAIRLESDLD
jgi:transcriptional regulator with XRE-family HTH domain